MAVLSVLTKISEFFIFMKISQFLFANTKFISQNLCLKIIKMSKFCTCHRASKMKIKL